MTLINMVVLIVTMKMRALTPLRETAMGSTKIAMSFRTMIKMKMDAMIVLLTSNSPRFVMKLHPIGENTAMLYRGLLSILRTKRFGQVLICIPAMMMF